MYRKEYSREYPYRIDKPNAPSSSEYGMDEIVDYVWCRLSEKCIKMSKAFRSMDISIVLFICISNRKGS